MIGGEGQGLLAVFGHERWVVCLEPGVFTLSLLRRRIA